MPLFRLRTGDGFQHLVEAHRLRVDELCVYAEDCCVGLSPPWTVILELPLPDVVAVHRRLDHPDGRHDWSEAPLQSPSGLRYLPDARGLSAERRPVTGP
jgi:hypothetical protein